jgi:hypothetical protein
MIASAKAAVVISSAQTQDVSCSGGICTPTATDAVLNVSELETMLISGNVTVTSTGSGVQADDIDLNAALAWSSQNVLSLDAYRSVTISKNVLVTGSGGLSLTTNDGGSGGSFAVTVKGSVVFQNLSSPLIINGTKYILANSISSLAGAIAANPSGAFALANSYDASADGTYSESPIQTALTGLFEGLGNSISNLSINGSGYIGLFQQENGSVENLELSGIDITVNGSSWAGGLAAIGGNLSHVRVTGRIRGKGKTGNSIGGLVGGGGEIVDCSTDVRITETQPSAVGGLVAVSGDIDQSYSTGSISVSGNGQGLVGGLVGSDSESHIQDSYATGAVTGGAGFWLGGFAGENGEGGDVFATIETSYSIGAVIGGDQSKAGGFAGYAFYAKARGYIAESYWDTTTSGTDKGVGGGRKHGVTGLTTQQLQSGLPTGFDPTIWAENPKINNGLPYLITNPPPK